MRGLVSSIVLLRKEVQLEPKAQSQAKPSHATKPQWKHRGCIQQRMWWSKGKLFHGLHTRWLFRANAHMQVSQRGTESCFKAIPAKRGMSAALQLSRYRLCEEQGYGMTCEPSDQTWSAHLQHKWDQASCYKGSSGASKPDLITVTEGWPARRACNGSDDGVW